MIEVYICDSCKKFLAPKKDKGWIVHVIGSKGELYLCPECYKEEKKRQKGGDIKNGEDLG